MEKIVIDTDIIINHARGKDRILSEAIERQEMKKAQLFVPSVVVFEFYSGLSMKSSPKQEIADMLFSQFEVVDVNTEIAKLAASMNRGNNLYKQIGAVDILVAATTVCLDAKLLTMNKKHFNLIPDLVFS